MTKSDFRLVSEEVLSFLLEILYKILVRIDISVWRETDITKMWWDGKAHNIYGYRILDQTIAIITEKIAR